MMKRRVQIANKKKEKNKAFTLIELLAVIVILAVIALIATPIVLNIIEKAKKSAFLDSAYGMLETAKLEYTEGLLEGTSGNKTYNYPFEDLNFNGSKPNGGSIVVDANGNTAIAIHNNKWCAKKETDESSVKIIAYNETTCKIGNLPSNPTESTFNIGDEVIFDPGDGININWNVLEDNGNTVTLILNHNLGEPVAWQISNRNSDGPLTALETLNLRTESWNHVPAIDNYEYINNVDGTTYDNGYQKVKIVNGVATITKKDGTITTVAGTSRARLITGQEAAKIMNTVDWDQGVQIDKKAPAWLFNQLSTANGLHAYWTLSTYPKNELYVWHVTYEGSLHAFDAGYSTNYGIRPVIHISKSELISK